MSQVTLDLNKQAKSGKWLIGLLLCASKHKFSHPASATLPNLKLSFVSSLGTHRLSLPIFWMTFSLLVGLKSANPFVFTPAARSLLSALMHATCLSSNGTGLIC
jgi:hypothetical protein